MIINTRALPTVYSPGTSSQAESSGRSEANSSTSTDSYSRAHQKGQSRQQTVEYIFDAEVVEEVSDQRAEKKPRYVQVIDPKNQSAIDQYQQNSQALRVNDNNSGQILDLYL